MHIKWNLCVADCVESIQVRTKKHTCNPITGRLVNEVLYWDIEQAGLFVLTQCLPNRPYSLNFAFRIFLGRWGFCCLVLCSSQRFRLELRLHNTRTAWEWELLLLQMIHKYVCVRQTPY